ncbi:MFS transporter (plasmid) [Paraburkholderia sp. PREW-6R]|uniref:MFS transporter n=1 Tax=Paraburkholderia sp. PREW-6R TaxID=3141544 RepID=UPI0031F573BA
MLISAFLGTAIEQYDFLSYGTASALVFNQLFFPYLDPLGTIASLGTYVVGYVARGAGALICGHFGDRIGRKMLLMVTLLVMSIASTLAGCLPTYASIGTWALILLTTLRVLQGFAIGAEQSGAIVLGIESAPAPRRGLYGSWSDSGSYGDVPLSTGALPLTSLLPEPAFLSWGWRVSMCFAPTLTHRSRSTRADGVLFIATATGEPVMPVTLRQCVRAAVRAVGAAADDESPRPFAARTVAGI